MSAWEAMSRIAFPLHSIRQALGGLEPLMSSLTDQTWFNYFLSRNSLQDSFYFTHVEVSLCLELL